MFRFIQITIFLICFSQLATATPNTIENEPIYWGLGIGVIAVPNDHYDDLEGGVALINQVLIGKQYDLIWKVRFLTEAGYLQTYDNHIERENNTSGFWIGMGQKLDILSERDKFSIIARQAIGEFGGVFSQGVEYKLRPNLLIRGEVELVNFFGAGFRFHGIYRF